MSDGQFAHVVDVESSKELEYVENVVWSLSADDHIGRAWIQVALVPVELVGEAKVIERKLEC